MKSINRILIGTKIILVLLVLSPTFFAVEARANIRTCEMTFKGTILSAFFIKIGEAQGEMDCYENDGTANSTLTPIRIHFTGISTLFAGLCSVDNGYVKLAGVGLTEKDALGLFAQVELGPVLPEIAGGEGGSSIVGLKLGILNPSISAFAGSMDIGGGELCPFPNLVGISIGEVHDRRLWKKKKAEEERRLLRQR